MRLLSSLTFDASFPSYLEPRSLTRSFVLLETSASRETRNNSWSDHAPPQDTEKRISLGVPTTLLPLVCIKESESPTWAYPTLS